MNPEVARPIFLACSLAFLAFLTLRNKQDTTRNWSMFYSSLYITAVLPIANVICINLGFWKFLDPALPLILMPYDIFFLWIISWGVVPIFFLERRRYILIVIAIVFWLDIVLMPALERVGILQLNDSWLIGEVALIATVFIPAYLWAYAYTHQKWIWFRALLQVIVMICIFIFGLPFLLSQYGLLTDLTFAMNAILFLFFLIIAFPGLVAVINLVQVGKGTPFPYDKTTRLVTSGVYAYIRNPIQWSFTLIFVPMAIYHGSWFLLTGMAVSLAYILALANFHEYDDMEARFGTAWTKYKSVVPNWYFQWKPLNIPMGTVYIDWHSDRYSHLSNWYARHKPINLDIRNTNDLQDSTLQQVIYIDGFGQRHHGVMAVVRSLEHIHLGFATLSWFMRFSGIIWVIDSILNCLRCNHREQ